MKRAYDLFDRFISISMPARKKGKPDPQSTINHNQDQDSTNSLQASSITDKPRIVTSTTSASSSRPVSVASSSTVGQRKTQDVGDDGKSIASNRTASWYGGSWKSKAPAMTKLDKDTNVTPNATPERPKLASPDAKESPSSPSKYMSKDTRRSSKSVPVAAAMSLVTASSRGPTDATIENVHDGPGHAENAPLPPDPAPAKDSTGTVGVTPTTGADTAVESKEPVKLGTSTWRGWWSKPDAPAQIDTEQKQAGVLAGAQEAAEQTPLPGSPEAIRKSDPMEVPNANGSAGGSAGQGEGAKIDGSIPSSQNRSSWFWAWSRAQNAKSDSTVSEEQPAPAKTTEDQQLQTEVASEQAKTPPPPEVTSAEKPTTAASSSWAFWSREKTKSEDASETASTRKEVGELAVADTPSQSKPEAAQFNERGGAPKKEVSSISKKTRGRLTGNESCSSASTSGKGTPSGSPSGESRDSPRQQTAPTQVKKKAQQATQNQNDTQPTLNTKNALLPQFDGTYHPAEHPSYWDQIRRFFVRAGPEQPRLNFEPNPQRVQRALAIGVHGFFPAAILRQVLGQPTGTSIRFSNYAASAIKEWVAQHGDYDCEIEKVALEGEGFIADRVDTLWKLLLNWIDKIRQADLILIAAHSQGVPVATMLVAKLIQFGCVNSSARIGICAMAGINMGPFSEYRTSWLGSTANELFEFSRPESKVSIMYEEALDECLRHGVRICYIGSIDDQLVSLESSTFTPITHPYIYRAVFVHSSLLSSTTALNPLKPQPDFIASLVGFALKLRNLGVPDHGLIRELSPALAGSLVGGDGHSSLYNDLNVYLLAVRCTLETTPLHPAKNPPVERWGLSGASTTTKASEKDKGRGQESAAVSANVTTASSNPFFLPWALRGVLEEELVRKELGDECRDLLSLFESWRPVSKGLKDVRFRLEAVRSKL